MKLEHGFVNISDLSQIPHFLVLEVLLDVADPAGRGVALSHNQDPLLTGLRVDLPEPDAGDGLYPLHRLPDDGHLGLDI